MAMAYGGRPVILLGVKRSMANMAPRLLVQYVSGCCVSPRRMHSLIVQIVRSTYPLALLLPTVIRWWAIPRTVHNLWKLPENSAPLSVRTYLGLPQRAIMSQ